MHAVKSRITCFAPSPIESITRCQLDRQLERRISDVYLTPFGVIDFQLSIQEICVEGRKRRRVGAIEYNGA